MAYLRKNAKNLVTPKRKRTRKIVNWFAHEFRADFLGKTYEEKAKILFQVMKDYYQELYYKHDLNTLPVRKAIIKYYISFLTGKPNKELAEKINACPYVYTALAWFEAVAFI